MGEDRRTSRRVLLMVFLVLVLAVTDSQAQRPDFHDGTATVTNENQLADAYHCDVFGLMAGPTEFRVWLTVEQLEQALAWWIRDYNEDYPHSAIGYQTPQQFETSFHPQPLTPKTLQIAA